MRYLFAIALAMTAPVAAASLHRATPVRPVHPVAHKVDWTHTVVKTPQGGYRLGNPAAPVKLVEYGSRTCPHCAHFAAEGVTALTNNYVKSGKVSYEFRDYPVHGAIDMGPILLGHCVAPGRFFALLGAMMANQQALIGRADRIPDAEAEKLQNAPPNVVVTYLSKFYGYTDFAIKQGVSPQQAAACLADRKALQAIAQQTEAANARDKIASTPTFIINDKLVDHVADWASLEPALIAAGAH